MRYLPLLLCAAALLPAADRDFNGRWNITPSVRDRGRAWWLEVRDAESSRPMGRFVGAPGGQMDEITDLSVKNGELRFSFTRLYGKFTNAPSEGKPQRGVYQAKLVNGQLQGSFAIEGVGQQTTWTGVRAPVLKDKDDGSWRAGKPVSLFNGKDLSGWQSVGGGEPRGWQVQDGILRNALGASNLVSDAQFWNFRLHAEYRVAQESNSGFGLRNRYEVQIFGDYGHPPSKSGHAALYSRIVPTSNASRPPDQWQTLDVTLIGREITVVLNGTTVIDHKEVEGLTAVAVDADESKPGAISLQGDHGSVEFRKLTVTPLTR